LAAPVVIVIIAIVPVTHPLVVILTVSHVPPSVASLEVSIFGELPCRFAVIAAAAA
jgi:hypothetical protein